MVAKPNFILHETAHSLAGIVKEKINQIYASNPAEYIFEICRNIVTHLDTETKRIYDSYDLIDLKAQINWIFTLLEYFLSGTPQKTLHWAEPLMEECYARCDLDYSSRKVIILATDDLMHYAVQPDVLKTIPHNVRKLFDNEVIDLFYIPKAVHHDVVSIALIGHEIGHVFLSHNGFSKSISAIVGDLKNKVPLGHSSAEKIAAYIEEYFCDTVGRSCFGPAFDLALTKHFSPLPNSQSGKTHPSPKNRTELSVESLAKLGEKLSTSKKFSESSLTNCLKIIVDDWNKILSRKKHKSEITREEEFAIAISNSIHNSKTLKRRFSEPEIKELTKTWDMVIPELNAFRPPFETVDEHCPEVITPIQMVISTAIYYHGRQYENENEFFQGSAQIKDDFLKTVQLRDRLVEHLKFAIGLYNFVKIANEEKISKAFNPDALSYTLWTKRVKKLPKETPNSFIITPTIDPNCQYGSNSVDLRLGPKFLIHKPSQYTHIPLNPKGRDNTDLPLEVFYDEIYTPIGQDFILHPNQFVLACTLEYISMPLSMYALVLGRSTWGRLGLNIATATTVQAGFRGCLTLELRNLGETPLTLTVGTRIAQICLIKTPKENFSEAHLTSGRYNGAVGPEVPKIREDQDWDLLKRCIRS